MHDSSLQILVCLFDVVQSIGQVRRNLLKAKVLSGILLIGFMPVVMDGRAGTNRGDKA